MLYTMNEKYQYAKPTVKYFKVIENGYKDWNSSLKSLYSSCLHSIENNTGYGYKSENWRDKKYINEIFEKLIKFLSNCYIMKYCPACWLGTI